MDQAAVCPTAAGVHTGVVRGRVFGCNIKCLAQESEAAWAASHAKDSYLAKQYRGLAARRGKKRALLALGHTILVVIYHLLKNKELRYHDLGADFFDRVQPERLRRYLVRRLQQLGYEVVLSPAEGSPHAA
jgi:transposase